MVVSEIKEIIEGGCKPSLHKDESMSHARIWKNLIMLSIGFLFHFSGFMALTNLQSTLNNVGNIGVISQSVIYITFTISSALLPKLIIKKLGLKITIVVCILTFTPYIAANLYPKAWTLIPTAIILGTGAGNLWTSVSTYINDLSFLYANEDADIAKLSTSKFFGIFQMFFQSTQIWGNTVSYFILRESHKNSTTNFLMSNSNVEDSVIINRLSCGASFCGGVNQKMQSPTDDKRFMLIGIDICFSILSGIVLAVFLDSLTEREEAVQSDESVISKLAATFRHLKKTDQLLLVILTTFCGMQQGFIYGDFTRSYIACAWGLENVGLVFVCFGVVSSIMCIVTGYVAKYVPRVVQLLVAAGCHMSVFISLLLWKPTSDAPWTFFVIVGCWAISDAIWQTQLAAFYGVLFRADEEAAFANFRLWEALGLSVAFGFSSLICTSSKIYMQLTFLVVGLIGYMVVEFRIFRRKKKFYISKPL